MKNIVFIGGDRRMIFAAKRLSVRYNCALYGFGDIDVKGLTRAEKGSRFDCAVLPILTGNTRFDPEILTDFLEPDSAVFAGRVPPELPEFCERHGLELYDYLKREEFAVMNAVLTAEAAAGIAIRETESSVFGANVLVLGFGRIGKLVSRYFVSLGAKVTAAARKPSDLAWIRANGYNAVNITDAAQLSQALSGADIILNTVPAPILSGNVSEAVRPEALLIELASVPCTDGTESFRTVKAGGLPGKTAPITAGCIIAETIENITDERRNQNGGA